MTSKLIPLICGLLALSAAGLCQAQTAAPDPTRLPGDMPPPALSVMLRPPSGRPLPPPDTTPSPSLALALEAAQTALSACTQDGLRVGVAVTDSLGQIRVGLSSDGTGPGAVYGAVRKDVTAIGFKASTSAVQARLRADPTAAALLTPNMEVRPGAVPLIAQGQVLGAIAVDGATAQQDEVCATMGAAKINDRLQSVGGGQ